MKPNSNLNLFQQLFFQTIPPPLDHLGRQNWAPQLSARVYQGTPAAGEIGHMYISYHMDFLDWKLSKLQLLQP